MMSAITGIILAIDKPRALVILSIVFAVAGLILASVFLFRYCRLRLRDMNECPDFLNADKTADTPEEDTSKS